MPETNIQRALLAFLVQVVFYALLWVWDEYIALFISIVFSSIALFLLLIALISEWIERSKVPSFFFQFFFICIISPWLLYLVFHLIGKDL